MNPLLRRLQQHFPKDYLLIPRPESIGIKSDENVTFSKLVKLRNRNANLEDASGSYHNEFEKLAQDVLKKLGLIDFGLIYSVIRAKTQDIKNSKGQFISLSDLGMMIAHFNNDDEAKRAKDKLSDKYKFIPDFPMCLPVSKELEDNSVIEESATLEVSKWPEISGIPEAHRREIKGKIKDTNKGILVGVLDTGIDSDHEQFSPAKHVKYGYVPLNVPPGSAAKLPDVRGFDPIGHGTKVCGILCGETIGIVPHADLYVASVVGSETALPSLNRVIFGLSWLLKQFSSSENRGLPAIVNMSVLFPTTPSPTLTPMLSTQELLDAYIEDFRISIVKLITDANALPVASIGNSGEGKFNYPGAFKEVLGVGAVDFDLQVYENSGSRNPQPGETAPQKPDIVGYGVNVYTSVGRDSKGVSNYIKTSGTSFAAPYVTGIAALYRSQEPELSVEQIKAKILENALQLHKPPHNQPKERVGAGLARFSTD